MNIALFITGLQRAGAERQVCDLADQYASMGHRVLLVSLSGELVQKPASDQVQLESLDMQRSAGSFLSAYFRLRNHLRHFKPDVVHSHLIHANLFARLLRLSTGFPRLICTAHNTRVGGRFSTFAYRITDRLADLSTNVSTEAVQAFIDAGAVRPGRMITMHNGINTNEFKATQNSRLSIRRNLDLAQNTPLLLAVGRLTEQKDYPNLFRALEQVLQNHPDTKLMVAGTGTLKASLLADAQRLGIEDNVMFLGLRDDVADLMNAADVMVLSSAWEGFGLVVAEAMACECPVVATDSGGVKEVLGDSGRLVPRQDSKALATAINEILSMDASEKQHLGALARSRVLEHYSIESAAQRWITLYQA